MKKKEENRNYKQRFMNGFHMLTGAKSLYTVWSDLMLLYSIEIINTTMRPLKNNEPFKEVWNGREEQYIKTIKTYNKKRTENHFPNVYHVGIRVGEEPKPRPIR